MAKKVKKAKKKEYGRIVNKKGKTEFLIKTKKVLEFGKTTMGVFADETLIYEGKNKGKNIKSDCITIRQDGIVRHVFFNREGNVSLTADVTLKDLETLVKKAKASAKYFKKLDAKRKKDGHISLKSFFIHLNPELSFLINYKESK